MSYDISVHDHDGNMVETDHGQIGGTYQTVARPQKRTLIGRAPDTAGLGDGPEFTYRPITTHAELNVTFNYARHYRKVWGFSLEELDNMIVARVRPLLEQAVRELGTDTDPDYWAALPGNAGAAALSLWLIMEDCDDDHVVRVHS